MLQLVPLHVPPTGSNHMEYERVVGIECRNSTLPASSSSSGGSSACGGSGNNSSWLADILIALYDGRETKIEAVRYSFTRHTAQPVGDRRTLLKLSDQRDVVQASCSDVGRNGEVMLSFTERVLVPRKFPSELSQGQYNGGPGMGVRATSSRTVDGGGGCTTSGVLQPPVNDFRFHLWLHVLNTDIFMDVTYTERGVAPSTPSLPNALPVNQVCQVGYMIRPEPKGNIFWLRACDHSAAGLQAKELVYNKKKSTLEVKGTLEWNFAQKQVWHHWDPFSQRLMFCTALPYYKFRVVRLLGHPEKRRCEFEQNLSKLPHPLYAGRPSALPWSTANCTNCVLFHLTILPVRYECDEEDYALCRQLLPSECAAAVPERYLTKIVCLITLLRNYIDSIEVEIELERPLYLSENYRVAFLFVHGMIAIYLPNVFVHYVDVHHKEREPRYLFGISLSPELAPTSPGHGGDVGSALLPGTSPPVASSGYSHVRQCSYPKPGSYTGTEATDRSNSGSNHNSSGLGMGGAKDAVVTLPIPSGNWLLTPDTTRIAHVGLTKASLWKYVGDRLSAVTVAANDDVFGIVSPTDVSALHHVVHVIAAHFSTQSQQVTPQTPTNASKRLTSHFSVTPSSSSEKPLSGNAHNLLELKSQEGDEDCFASNLQDLLAAHWREIRPSFFLQLIIGEAYQVTRTVCKAKGNPYYLCMAMTDDRSLQQTLDECRQRQDLAKKQHQRCGIGGGAHDPVSSPTSPRGTNVNVRGGALHRGSDPALKGGGGAVTVRPQRTPDANVKDVCHNTDPDWWLNRGIKQSTTLFSQLRSFGRVKVLPITRILVADGAKHAAMRRDRGVTLVDVMRCRLQAVGVPSEPAAEVATKFEATLRKVVDEIVAIVVSPRSASYDDVAAGNAERLPVAIQFHILHHVVVAVHAIGLTMPPALADSFAVLAASTLPATTVLQGMKAGLYTPSIVVLEQAYPVLRHLLKNLAMRYGVRIMDAQQRTHRVPLCVASPPLQPPLSSEGNAHHASWALSSPVPSFSLLSPAGPATTPPDVVVPPVVSEPPPSRRATRYHHLPSGALAGRSLVTIPSHQTFQQWTLMNAVCTATEAEREREKKEFAISAFEVGPSLQCAAHRLIPRDIGIDFKEFAPWKVWNSKRPPMRPPTAAPLRGGSVVGPGGWSPEGGTPLFLTESMKKERAREAVQYALGVFLVAPINTSIKDSGSVL